MRRQFLGVLLALPLIFVAEGTWGAEPACVSRSPADVVAVVRDTCITARELDLAVGNEILQIRADEYNLKRTVLDEIVATALLEHEAVVRGVTVEALTQQEVTSKVSPVTDLDLRAVVGMRDPQAAPPDAAEQARLTEAMNRHRVQQRRAAFVKELRERSRVEVRLEAPRVAVATDKGSSRGPRDAPITLVAFSDFECSACAQASVVLKAVERRYGDKVRIVHRNFPRPFHKYAPKAAEAAACAGEQGRFWEFHDRLLAQQTALGLTDLSRHAAELALDRDAFDTCLASGRQARTIEEDLVAGRQYGVQRVPSFFVNGRFLVGAAPLEPFSLVIDEELARVARAAAATAGGGVPSR